MNQRELEKYIEIRIKQQLHLLLHITTEILSSPKESPSGSVSPLVKRKTLFLLYSLYYEDIITKYMLRKISPDKDFSSLEGKETFLFCQPYLKNTLLNFTSLFGKTDGSKFSFVNFFTKKLFDASVLFSRKSECTKEADLIYKSEFEKNNFSDVKINYDKKIGKICTVKNVKKNSLNILEKMILNYILFQHPEDPLKMVFDKFFFKTELFDFSEYSNSSFDEVHNVNYFAFERYKYFYKFIYKVLNFNQLVNVIKNRYFPHVPFLVLKKEIRVCLITELVKINPGRGVLKKLSVLFPEKEEDAFLKFLNEGNVTVFYKNHVSIKEGNKSLKKFQRAFFPNVNLSLIKKTSIFLQKNLGESYSLQDAKNLVKTFKKQKKIQERFSNYGSLGSAKNIGDSLKNNFEKENDKKRIYGQVGGDKQIEKEIERYLVESEEEDSPSSELEYETLSEYSDEDLSQAEDIP